MKKVGMQFRPETVEELSQLVRDTEGPIVFGVGNETHVGWPTELRRTLGGEPFERFLEAAKSGDTAKAVTLNRERWNQAASGRLLLEVEGFGEIFEFLPEDQVVRCSPYISVSNHPGKSPDANSPERDDDSLQKQLMLKGQCLPLPNPAIRNRRDLVEDQSGAAFPVWTVNRALALNFPHSLQTQCGSWRDWVLGMTVLLADGTLVKTGSKAVKSVAGYDLHKLMIGAYDTLGIVVDVTLRTFPLKALPQPDLTWGPASDKFKGDPVQGRYVWRQKVLRSHYADALAGAGDSLLYGDNAGCTLWCWLDSPDQELPRYAGDWVVRTGCGEKNVQITDPTQIRFMKRAKQIFDPTGKLNPGEFGFL